MTVFVLPPKESSRRRVNLEVRYGMCYEFASTSALITLPKACHDIRVIRIATYG
jgi:hypothetical protein